MNTPMTTPMTTLMDNPMNTRTNTHTGVAPTNTTAARDSEAHALGWRSHVLVQDARVE